MVDVEQLISRILVLEAEVATLTRGQQQIVDVVGEFSAVLIQAIQDLAVDDQSIAHAIAALSRGAAIIERGFGPTAPSSAKH